MTDAPRVIIHDHEDAVLGELDPTCLRGLTQTSVVNGEHALEVTTTQELSKGDRLIFKDTRGIWHEYVVEGVVSSHGDGGKVVSEYYCIWSLQHDLMQTFVDDEYGCGIVPGHASVMHPATDGLTIALSTTLRWTVGTVTVTSGAAASFYRRSGWEALQTVVEKWGGELQASITVSTSGVVSRAVDLLEAVGQQTATRRFDYGGDVSSIKRTVADDPWTCRIIPLGKGQETEEGGYTRRPTIESVNGDVMWLENSAMVPYCRVPDGNGGWEYPVQIVYNDTYEEPSDLKAWALDNLTELTQPKVSYEADVIQLERAGMSPLGVSLGDKVAVVDREFGADGLQLEARVMKMVENLLDSSDIKLTISTLLTTLASQMSGIERVAAEVSEQVSSSNVYTSTAAYVSNLIARLNAEANSTGGYTYITEGEGIRTYDTAVSDPLVGSEASQVTDIRGGTMRFANSRTSGGDWDFTTIIQAGLIASKFLTASNVLTGMLEDAAHREDPSTGNFWNLDTGEFHNGTTWILPNGLLVAKVGDAFGVYLNSADDQMEIRSLTWSAGQPTVGTSVWSAFWDSGASFIGGDFKIDGYDAGSGTIQQKIARMQRTGFGTAARIYMEVGQTLDSGGNVIATWSSEDLAADSVRIGNKSTHYVVATGGGTVVKTLSSQSSVQILTASEVAGYVGSGASNLDTVVHVCNGDTAAYNGMVTGGIASSGAVTAYLQSAHSGLVRFNFTITRYAI